MQTFKAKPSPTRDKYVHTKFRILPHYLTNFRQQSIVTLRIFSFLKAYDFMQHQKEKSTVFVRKEKIMGTTMCNDSLFSSKIPFIKISDLPLRTGLPSPWRRIKDDRHSVQRQSAFPIIARQSVIQQLKKKQLGNQ